MPKGDISVTEVLSILRRLRVAPKSMRAAIVAELVEAADKICESGSEAVGRALAALQQAGQMTGAQFTCSLGDQGEDATRKEIITEALVAVRFAMRGEKDPVRLNALVCSARKLNKRLEETA